MAVPYNLIPIEAHLAMITAEQANVPVLADAAKMWTEVRSWIESARVELHTRASDLAPSWKDQAGREMEEKFQRADAELKMWGERIDGAQVVETLTTLASAIPQAFQTVSGLYQSYLAALSNPFTAAGAVMFQQAAGTQLTALGAQFDMSMLKVCAAAGIKSPGDVLPETKGSSTKEILEAATASVDAATAVGSLASTALQGGGGGGALPQVDLPDGTTGGLPGGTSLAGAIGTPTPTPPTGHVGAGGSPSGFSGPPVAMGLSGTTPVATGSTAAVGRSGARRPTPESRLGTVSAKQSGAPGTPPMMPPHGRHQQQGTLRPAQAAQAGRSRTSKRQAEATDGVPRELRGRATTAPAFTFARVPSPPTDDDLWRSSPS